MNVSKRVAGLTLALGLAGTAIAAPAALKPGAAVVDTAGNPVGRIASIDGDLAIVDTGANKVGLPASSFGDSDKGVMIAMTRAQLDEAAGQAKAKAQAELLANLKPGAAVYGTDATRLGTVDSVDAQFLTLALHDGRKIKLPLAAVSRGEAGPVVGMSAAQLKAALPAPVPTPAPPEAEPAR
jgi:preprotein translocase subunit YajC